MSIACPSCGASCADDFHFCPYCATTLTCEPVFEERKVVTALFCDLVGFTTLSERHDHEEIDAYLAAYSAAARRVVTLFGGAIEKFIGDAVAAVFGFPLAHDDDPLRAVRAGLRLVDELRALPPLGDDRVQARIGVNTGEVYARLGVDPASGQTFVTGDVINTAARLQTVAPPMGVAVGGLTQRLTARFIEYAELPAADLKGKAQAVRVWQAVGERAPHDGPARGERTGMVGRRAELDDLGRLWKRCVAERRSQVAFVVGEPGIGKSRLLAELAALGKEQHGESRWLQGSCLPYGEGAALSALAQAVRRHAGILDDDPADEVERLLAEAVPAGPDREWILLRLRPLVGLPAQPAAREDNFAAWTSLLQHLALEAPTVLVLEDLHWADDELLAFVGGLARLRVDGPLLVLGTGRPELTERAPGLFGGPTASPCISLSSLHGDDVALLAGDILGERLGDEVAALVEERTGGNPLFVQEYVQLLHERALLRGGRDGVELSVDVAELPPPESLQGVIGARLDLLEGPVKAVLADAAVLGETFWLRGVAAVGGYDDDSVDKAVRELLARQMVREVEASSFADEATFVFWHALTREVAYGRLPRKLRVVKHRAAAGWIEAGAGAPAGDVAELLAYHYATAFELAQALRDAEAAAELRAPAIRSLALAGEKAEPLDGGAAERHYSRALAIVAEADPRRFQLMARRADMLSLRGRARDAAGEFEAAIAGLLEAGDARAAARAALGLSDALSTLGDLRFREVAAQAEVLARSSGSSSVFVEALGTLAAIAHDDEGPQRALEILEEAEGIAREAGAELPPWALGLRGRARCALGDAGGLGDIREAIRAAEAQGHRSDQASLTYELAWSQVAFEGPAPALDALRECVQLGRRSHMEGMVTGARSVAARSLYWTGDWDVALEECQDLAPEVEAAEDAWALAIVRYVWSLVLLGRGDAAAALPLAVQALEVARDNPIRGVSAVYCVAAAAACQGVGDAARALTFLHECESVLSDKGETLFVYLLPLGVRTAVAAGDEALARRLAAGVAPILPFGERVRRALLAQVLELDGDWTGAAVAYAHAADGWRDFSMPFEQAHALLGAGRCLAQTGDHAGAADPLRQAAAMFATLGAAPALREADAIIERYA